MIGIVLEWLTRQWLEIVGVAITVAALFYAHLAYRIGLLGLDQAKKAELNSLRIQAKAGMNDARQAQVSLELTCQIFRANWASHALKQRVMLTGPLGRFERSAIDIDKVQFEGNHLLQQLSASGETVDEMDLQALEALMQKAKATSLSIQGLAGKLESPP